MINEMREKINLYLSKNILSIIPPNGTIEDIVIVNGKDKVKEKFEQFLKENQVADAIQLICNYIETTKFDNEIEIKNGYKLGSIILKCYQKAIIKKIRNNIKDKMKKQIFSAFLDQPQCIE